jgi:hypothetical protein
MPSITAVWKPEFLIGIGHRMQTGKGTVAAYLCKHYGFTELAFAGPLKAACREVFSLSESQLYGDDKLLMDEFWQMSPGKILQIVGTELFRDRFAKDIWVKATFRKIQSLKLTRVCISDLRFKNEAKAIVDAKGICWKTNRPDTGDSQRSSTHPSEVDLLDYDQWSEVFDNSQDFDFLYAQVDRACEKLGLFKTG